MLTLDFTGIIRTELHPNFLIKSKSENEFLISPVQAAYRPRMSTLDHIFVLQELFLEYRFINLLVHVGPKLASQTDPKASKIEPKSIEN